jgi:hypothetical protein
MANDLKSMDWAFWFYWIMATTIGWMIGEMFFSGIPVIVSGVAISILQGVVLYKRIHRSWRWSVISALSWITGYVFHLLIFSSNTSIFIGPIIGGTIGLTQWLLLRKEFDWAGWWIMICILAWTTGLTTMPGLISSGALPGALTGVTLVILFRFSSLPKTTKA